MQFFGLRPRPFAWTTIATMAVLAIVALFGVLRLQVEFEVRRVLEQNAGEIRQASTLAEDLPWRHPDFIVALSFDAPLGPEVVAAVEDLAKALDADPRIEAATSIASLRLVDRQALLPKPFLDLLRTAGGDMQSLVREHPILERSFVSKDLRSTLVLVRARRDANDGFDRLAVLEWVRDFVAKRSVGAETGAAPKSVRLIGSSVVLATLSQKLREGIAQVLGLEVLCFLLLLPLLFRTWRGSILPLLVVLVSVLLNFGWMGLLGYPLTIIDVAIPGLIVIIGLCDAIHLQQCFEERYATNSVVGAVRDMLARVGKACFYTSFTTAVGFVSLVAAEHDAVSHFGLKAGVSVIVTFVVVLTLLPALLLVAPLGRPRPLASVRWSWLGYGRPRLIVSVTLLAMLFAGIGVTLVRVDSHLLEELPASSALARDFRWFEEQFSGIIDVEARVDGALGDGAVFRALERFEAKMLQEDGLDRVESLTLVAREAIGKPRGELSDADIAAAFARLRIARAFLPEHLVSADFETARVVFKARDIGSAKTSALRARIEEVAREVTPPGSALRIAPAGYVLMATTSTQVVLRTISQSLGISLLVITVFLGLIFGSVRLALLSLLTNVLPLAFALGVSGYLGIEVTIGSALIYCLGLGLAVDDTIHLLARYRYEARHDPEASPRVQITRALHSSGKALVTTSIVLAVGSLCHVAAEFQSLVHVGILLTTVIVVALATDLWLLPLLLERWVSSRRGT